MPQERISQILLEKAAEGRRVVRLKGGDPFLFGRGGEELELLEAHGVPFEEVPGITSAIAVPAYAGIPVTHRDMTSSLHIITGHARQGKELDIDFQALVRTKGTLVFLMGVTSLPRICAGLLEAGMDPETPRRRGGAGHPAHAAEGDRHPLHPGPAGPGGGGLQPGGERVRPGVRPLRALRLVQRPPP